MLKNVFTFRVILNLSLLRSVCFFMYFFLSEIKCHERKGSNVEGNIVCNAKLSFCYFFLLRSFIFVVSFFSTTQGSELGQISP